jgi:hypothetical protein
MRLKNDHLRAKFLETIIVPLQNKAKYKQEKNIELHILIQKSMV